MSQFDGQVGASTDDAGENSSGTVVTNTTTLTIGTSNNADYGGFRFQNVTVPQGATITAATIEYFNDNAKGSTDDPDLTIYAEEVDNATTFSTTASSISTRTRTTASVTWNATNLGLNAWHTSPDISSVIQEVVNRAGWASGNALNILTVAVSATQTVYFRTYDNTTSPANTYGLKLHITYTSGGATTATTFPMMGV